MKVLAAVVLTFTFTTLKNFVFPSIDLVIVMGFLIIGDFLTGVMKSIVLRIDITSWGFRKTLIKFLQYGGAILIGMGLSTVLTHKGIGTQIGLPVYMVDLLIVFISYIELVSILENLIAIDAGSTMSKKVFLPLHKVLTFQIENGFLSKYIEKKDNAKNKPDVD